jgi:hypothetical protein
MDGAAQGTGAFAVDDSNLKDACVSAFVKIIRHQIFDF